MEEVFGYIERITFQNGDSGFTVAWLKAPKVRDLICIVGNMTALQAGETVRCVGKWQQHLVHGRQFSVDHCQIEEPADLEGIKKYLGSGLVKGIGPVYADRIVKEFGVETLRVIDHDPKLLKKIPGIGKKRIGIIASCWEEQKSIREVMIYLQKQKISPAYAQKIYKTYGEKSIQKIQENPYYLARDIFGIGFKKADEIAANMGIEKESSQRIESGILFALHELASDGHVCYPVPLFLEYTSKMLDVEKKSVEESLNVIHEEEALFLATKPDDESEELFVWSKNNFLSEMGIAKEVSRIKEGKSYLREIHVEKAVAWAEEKLGIELAKNQTRAVQKALTEKFHIITGGPGTGKSTITNAVIQVMAKLTPHILLAAPTGRAAKRMTEVTGKKATTIHSLLEFDFSKGGFKRDRENPLETDFIIIDEASMIDTALMNQLLKAIPDRARLLLIGDINQLPSVGPGNVLRDIIDSKRVGVSRLNEIFRQAKGSKIITNSHRINQGIFPDLSNENEGDFFFLEKEEAQNVLETVLSLVTVRLPKKYGFNPLQDIQVLAPMRKGVIGIENINILLQEKLNRSQDEFFRNGRKYLVGDKVMQTRNNYKKEVFNGDIGRILSIDRSEQLVMIDFEGRVIEYDFIDLDEIVLAYAISIHKSQGSEYPCVVLPVHTSHFMMLHRNLLYTGVTRGKKLVVLVGTKKAIAIAVKNDHVKKRFTGLKEALHGLVKK